MFAKVKSLPASVQTALASLGYGKDDIAVTAAQSFCMRDGGSGQGQRAFVCVVNLETGDRAVTYGSWGGANMFNPNNAVDLDGTEYPLTANMVVISGSEGNKVYASIRVAAATLAPLLPSSPRIDDRDAGILAAYRGLKSGPYRNEALSTLKCTDADLDRLAGMGLLKRSKNGATSITTDGKNACAHVRTL